MRSAPTRCLLLAGLLLLGPLAGCSDPGEDVPVPISAMEAHEQAKPTVREWRADAQLVTLSGFEGSQSCPSNQRDEGGFPSHVDHVPGDGRAAQWVLIYAPPGDNTTRTLRVTENEATWLDEAGPTATTPTAVTNWTIDSTEALQRALDESPGFEALVASGEVCLFATLGSSFEGTTWQIVARSASQPATTTLFVDASTGEVTNRTEHEAEAGIQRFEGTIASANEAQRHEITLDADRSNLTLLLEFDASQGARLEPALTRDGATVNASERESGDGMHRAEWTNLAHSAYKVTVQASTMGNATSVDYRLSVRGVASG